MWQSHKPHSWTLLQLHQLELNFICSYGGNLYSRILIGFTSFGSCFKWKNCRPKLERDIEIFIWRKKERKRMCKCKYSKLINSIMQSRRYLNQQKTTLNNTMWSKEPSFNQTTMQLWISFGSEGPYFQTQSILFRIVCYQLFYPWVIKIFLIGSCETNWNQIQVIVQLMEKNKCNGNKNDGNDNS